jgi:hypothetical protein
MNDDDTDNAFWTLKPVNDSSCRGWTKVMSINVIAANSAFINNNILTEK